MKVSEAPQPSIANPQGFASWAQSVGGALQNRPFTPTITPSVGSYTHAAAVWGADRYAIYRVVNRLCTVVFNVVGTLSGAPTYVDMDLPAEAYQAVTIPVGVNNLSIDFVGSARVNALTARISLTGPMAPGACEFSGHLTYFTT